MKPVKFQKVKSNEIDFDFMTLINIVSNNGEIIYFFVCEFEQKFQGVKSTEKEVMQFDEEEFQIISQNYKIVD